MKQEILKLIEEKPKHFSKIINNRPDLKEWVMNNSTIDPNDPLVDQIYSALHPDESKVCIYGNTKGFSSIHNGFKFCGRAGTCQCAKESVSASVSASKALFTDEQIQASNAKRVATLQEKYDVDNAGKLPQSKENHQAFYNDPEKVVESVNKHVITSTENWGVPHPMKNPVVVNKVKETCIEKYGHDNWAKTPEARQYQSDKNKKIAESGVLLQKGHKKFSKSLNELYNITLTTPVEEYNGCMSDYEWKCNVCNTTGTFNQWYYRSHPCKKCHPYNPVYRSSQEIEVFDYITNVLGISNGRYCDKTIINPYELDMVFPEQKIAIEYCGLYWHSEFNALSSKTPTYHIDKLEKTNNRGYRLVTIFSDEWTDLENQEITKNRLKQLFSLQSVNYTNLSFIEINSNVYNEFITVNYSSMIDNSTNFFGIYHDCSIVAVLAVNNEGDDCYQIDHYFEKLPVGIEYVLNNFEKMFNPEKISVILDMKWDDPLIYTQLGFIETSKTLGYWEIDESYVKRLNYVKNPNKTEEQIMFERGYDRIWDCGQIKFEKKFNKELNETQ